MKIKNFQIFNESVSESIDSIDLIDVENVLMSMSIVHNVHRDQYSFIHDTFRGKLLSDESINFFGVYNVDKVDRHCIYDCFVFELDSPREFISHKYKRELISKRVSNEYFEIVNSRNDIIKLLHRLISYQEDIFIYSTHDVYNNYTEKYVYKVVVAKIPNRVKSILESSYKHPDIDVRLFNIEDILLTMKEVNNLNISRLETTFFDIYRKEVPRKEDDRFLPRKLFPILNAEFKNVKKIYSCLRFRLGVPFKWMNDRRVRTYPLKSESEIYKEDIDLISKDIIDPLSRLISYDKNISIFSSERLRKMDNTSNTTYYEVVVFFTDDVKISESINSSIDDDKLTDVENMIISISESDEKISKIENASFDFLTKRLTNYPSLSFLSLKNEYHNGYLLSNKLRTIYPCISFNIDVNGFYSPSKYGNDILRRLNRLLRYRNDILIFRSSPIVSDPIYFKIVVFFIDTPRLKESISGWELVGQHMGPNYPEQELPVTLSTSDTEVLEGKNGIIYTWDDYQDLYNQYLKNGGITPMIGFNKNNLDTLIDFLNL